MPDPAPPPRSRGLLVAWLVLGVAVAVPVAWSMLNRQWEAPRPKGMSPEEVRKAMNHLADESPVVGVVIGGKARAFPIRLMMRPDQHVINELHGSTAVSVSFCDIDKCVRVFTAGDRDRPLDLMPLPPDGSRPGKMVLRTGDKKYWQDTGLPIDGQGPGLPYEKVKHERTTWGEWRKAHPDSEVREASPFPSQMPR
jgi:hypothetical protein